MSVRVIQGDCRKVLLELETESVNCCVTSPPYFGLRDYGCEGQIGLEKTPEEFVERMVNIFREVRRVLTNDGTLWLNLGDSYNGSGKATGRDGLQDAELSEKQSSNHGSLVAKATRLESLKPKDLIGIPWRVAFALQANGWYLRQDIIWHKPNPMPESVLDRCTKAHEYIFMFSKSERYHYDNEAIQEDAVEAAASGLTGGAYDCPGSKPQANARARETDKQRGHGRRHAGFNDRWDAMSKTEQCSGKRNKRSVWTVAPASYPGAHFATFPTALIKPCILAGCPKGGTVLDPFGGSGTTGEVARDAGCHAILIELNESYIPLIDKRLEQNVMEFSHE